MDHEQELVAFMPSYGRVVGMDALYELSITKVKSGLKGGLKRLLYMCAFISQKARALRGLRRENATLYRGKGKSGSIFRSKSLPTYAEFDPSGKGYSLELRIPISNFTTTPRLRATGARNC